MGKKQGRTPKVVQDMREAFDDKSVNIVSIATPNHWHSLAAIWAMQAGKDVYVEKPVSHNVSEGRRIVETARKHNRICQAGTQCRSMKGTIDAIEYVKSGKIGEVKLARGICYRPRGSIGPKGNYEVPPQVDYNLWCGPARMLPLTRKKFHYDWHWQREWGNGDMGNQGPHQMDIARWGLGLDRLADSAIAFGGRLGYEDAGDVANTEVGIFEFGDKTMVFEVRGLKTDPLRGAKRRRDLLRQRGLRRADAATRRGRLRSRRASWSRSSRAAAAIKTRMEIGFDSERQAGRGSRTTDEALRQLRRRRQGPRLPSCCAPTSSKATSPAPIATWRTCPIISASRPRSRRSARRWAALKTNEDVAECLDRTVKHLAANERGPGQDAADARPDAQDRLARTRRSSTIPRPARC